MSKEANEMRTITLTISEKLYELLEEMRGSDEDTVEIVAQDLLQEAAYGDEIQFLWRDLTTTLEQLDEARDEEVMNAIEPFAEVLVAVGGSTVLSVEDMHDHMTEMLSLLEAYLSERGAEQATAIQTFSANVYNTYEAEVEAFRQEMAEFEAMEEEEDAGGCGGNCSCHHSH